MACIADDRVAETRALATGLVTITDVEGLTVPLAFSCLGQLARIYIPAAWTGMMRDAAIVLMILRLVSPALSADECAAIWADLLARVIGPLGGDVVGRIILLSDPDAEVA